MEILRRLESLKDYMVEIGGSSRDVAGFSVRLTRSSYAFVGPDGKLYRSRRDVARGLKLEDWPELQEGIDCSKSSGGLKGCGSCNEPPARYGMQHEHTLQADV